MQVGILGPLEVRADGEPVDIAGPMVRALLVRLALDPGRAVGVATLADALWADDPPADVANALQSLVSRLRRSLGTDAIQRTATGYRLAATPDDIDACRFEQLAAAGSAALRAGDPRRAAAVLTEALALWRGPAFADVAEAEFALAPAVRLHDLRLAASLDRIEAELALGQAARAVPELEALAADRPLHERVTLLQMRALAASGRPADALAAFERLRTRLADELGTDPSAEVQAAHVAILRGETTALTAQESPVQRTNLRPALTTFIGRDAELGRLDELLATSRLVTIVGPGGAGKTRLISEAARRWVDTARDGVWFVPLAPVDAPEEIVPTVLSALGLREGPTLERTDRAPRDPLGRLIDALADREAVVILDNCEHLVAGAAEIADILLRECPRLRVAATSREPLGILGESLCVIPPLLWPDRPVTAGDALGYPAVRLFAERATAVQPDFTLDDDTVPAVIEIARRLDGLPLALELAAARLRTLPVGEVASRLSDRFRLLTGGSRTAMPRHRTLRAVVEWSWDLLSKPERLLAERIAVFPSGVTPESAAGVCADGVEIIESEVPDLLAALVDKSLLQLAGQDTVRYRMLETIREYGLERLDERGELAGVRLEHARHFGEFADEVDRHVRRADQLDWIRRFEAERDNVLAAARFLGDSGETTAALHLVITIASLWLMIGNHADSSTWLRFVVDLPDDGGPKNAELHVMAEAALALHTTESGTEYPGRPALRDISDRLENIDPAVHPLATLLKLAVALFADYPKRMATAYAEGLASSDPWVVSSTHMLRAMTAENDGDIDVMRVEAEEALVGFRRLGERWGMASTLQGLAMARMLDGDLEGALAASDEAITCMDEMGAHEDAVMLRLRRADIRLRLGDHAGALADAQAAGSLGEGIGAATMAVFALVAASRIRRLMGEPIDPARVSAEALERLQRIPHTHPVQGHAKAVIMSTIAANALETGDLDQALAHAVTAYTVGLDTHDMPVMANIGIGSARLALAFDRPVDAAEMLGATARLRGSDDPTDLHIRELTASMVTSIGRDGFDAAYAKGHALSKDAALARIDPKTVAPAAEPASD